MKRKPKTLLRERLNLPVLEIELKSGRVIKNYPLKGYNLSHKDSIIEHLNTYEMYEVTLGNYRRLWISVEDVKEIREI